MWIVKQYSSTVSLPVPPAKIRATCALASIVPVLQLASCQILLITFVNTVYYSAFYCVSNSFLLFSSSEKFTYLQSLHYSLLDTCFVELHLVPQKRKRKNFISELS